MFRFVHAADLHVDSPLRGLAYKEDAPVETLRAATRRAFEGLVRLALDEQVDFVLLAGDLIDGDWTDARTPIFLASRLAQLEQAGIPVFAVLGNHDAESGLGTKGTRLRHLRLLGAEQPESHRLEGLEPPVVIHGQSYGQREESRNLARGYPAATPGAFNIGLLHTSLTGRPGHAPYAPCSLADLDRCGYDYWALGHVHAREVVSRDPWIVFPGCLQGRHPRETGPKGAALVTVTDGGVTDVEFPDLDVVRWDRIAVALPTDADDQTARDSLERAFTDALERADGRPVALRVDLTASATTAQGRLADPVAFSEMAQVIAADVGGDQIWLERIDVQFAFDPPAEAPEHALGELLESLRALPNSPAVLDPLPDTLKVLLDKLSREARRQLAEAAAASQGEAAHASADAALGDGQAAPAGDVPDWLGHYVARAKALLLARLGQAGGAR